MPVYEYRCENGHEFEVIQRISDDPLTECQECQARVERVLHPVAVHFKGSGFYSTDYGQKKKAGAGEGETKKDGDSKNESKSKSSSSGDSKQSDAKSTTPSD